MKRPPRSIPEGPPQIYRFDNKSIYSFGEAIGRNASSAFFKKKKLHLQGGDLRGPLLTNAGPAGQGDIVISPSDIYANYRGKPRPKAGLTFHHLFQVVFRRLCLSAKRAIRKKITRYQLSMCGACLPAETTGFNVMIGGRQCR